jgi:hypothetical protein
MKGLNRMRSASCFVKKGMLLGMASLLSMNAVLAEPNVLEGATESSSQSDVTSAKPKIAFATKDFDFGVVAEGVKVAHQFSIKNAGDAPLEILRVVPSCGCTASSVEPSKIEAGAEGVLKVEFNTEGFSGEKSKTVRVFSNDPSSPIEVVSLKGTIKPQVMVSPAQVVFDSVVKGKPSEPVVVEVSVDPKANITVGSAKSFSSSLVVAEKTGEVGEASSAGKKLFQISVTGDAPVGDVRERVVVDLVGAQNKSVNIPVFAKVMGLVSATPQRVSFGIIAGETEIVRTVKVEISGDEPVSITKASSSNSAISVELNELAKGKSYSLNLKLNPKAVEEDLRSQILVETTSKEQPQLSIGVFGILPKS